MATSTYTSFRWSSTEPSAISAARGVFGEIASRRQVAVKLKELVWFEGGVVVPFKKPTTYHNGYMWFLNNLGHLAEARGNTDLWRVSVHEDGEAESAVPDRAAEEGAAAAAAHSEEAPPCRDSPQGPAATVETPRASLMLLALSSEALLRQRGRDYVLGKKLGQGTFGTVFAAERLGLRPMVCKVFASGDAARTEALREIAVYEKCGQHSCLTSLLDVVIAPIPPFQNASADNPEVGSRFAHLLRRGRAATRPEDSEGYPSTHFHGRWLLAQPSVHSR